MRMIMRSLEIESLPPVMVEVAQNLAKTRIHNIVLVDPVEGTLMRRKQKEETMGWLQLQVVVNRRERISRSPTT
jgi:hypothetical protein